MIFIIRPFKHYINDILTCTIWFWNHIIWYNMTMENFHRFNFWENNMFFCDLDLDTVLKASNMVIRFKRMKHGVGKRARTFPPDAEDTLWRHISKTCGATLFGATLFGDAAFSCDATFWRCIVWRHIVWWRHIFLWRHILAPHCLAPHCLVTPHFPVTPHFGATLFGATLFGDATFSCDATFWRHILWRHIVWWRHIGGCYVASVGLKLVGMV